MVLIRRSSLYLSGPIIQIFKTISFHDLTLCMCVRCVVYVPKDSLQLYILLIILFPVLLHHEPLPKTKENELANVCKWYQTFSVYNLFSEFFHSKIFGAYFQHFEWLASSLIWSIISYLMMLVAFFSSFSSPVDYK